MLKYFHLLLFSWMLGILSNKQKHDNDVSVVISRLLGDCNDLELFTIRSKEELGSMIVLSTVQCYQLQLRVILNVSSAYGADMEALMSRHLVMHAGM